MTRADALRKAGFSVRSDYTDAPAWTSHLTRRVVAIATDEDGIDPVDSSRSTVVVGLFGLDPEEGLDNEPFVEIDFDNCEDLARSFRALNPIASLDTGRLRTLFSAEAAKGDEVAKGDEGDEDDEDDEIQVGDRVRQARIRTGLFGSRERDYGLGTVERVSQYYVVFYGGHEGLFTPEELVLADEADDHDPIEVGDRVRQARIRTSLFGSRERDYGLGTVEGVGEFYVEFDDGTDGDFKPEELVLADEDDEDDEELVLDDEDDD